MKQACWEWWLLAFVLTGACGGTSELGASDAGTSGTSAGGNHGNDVGGGSTGDGGNAGASPDGKGGSSAGKGGGTTSGAGGTSSGAGGVPSVTGGMGTATSGTTSSEGGESASGAGAGGQAGEGGAPNCEHIVWVSEQLGNDSNDGRGRGWEHSVRTLQRALDLAEELEDDPCWIGQVYVAAGTYFPTLPTDPLDVRTSTFRLVPGVQVFGGFDETEPDLDKHDPVANVTVLSGDLGVLGSESDNSYHVVTGADEASLDGFTITGGYANGDSPNNVGAGMYNDEVSPFVTNCIFSGNTAASGAGMYNRRSSPGVTNSTFTDNAVVLGDGGGMFNEESSPGVVRCFFSDNEAQYTGGAISNYKSQLDVYQCTFTRNRATTGGAVYDDQLGSLITKSTFVANEGYSGGALFVAASATSVLDSVFTNNSAYMGGAIYTDSSPSVTSSIFYGNSAQGTARFTGDAHASGGAIYNGDTATSTVANSTFFGNSADYSGGAIYDAGSCSVTSSILWGDTTPEGISEIVHVGEVSAIVSYDVIQGGYADGLKIVAADPQFVDRDNGNFQLLAASSAIDAGTGCGTGTGRLLDQAGKKRWNIWEVPNADDGFDCGALEFQGGAGADDTIDTITCP